MYLNHNISQGGGIWGDRNAETDHKLNCRKSLTRDYHVLRGICGTTCRSCFCKDLLLKPAVWQLAVLVCCLFSGETVLTWKTDAVVIDVLVNACLHTVKNKLLQFAKADSSYRLLLYAGHFIAETGNWLLQDGTLSFHSFVKVFSAGCGGTGPVDVVTYPEGNWNASGLGKIVKRMRLNPEKSAASGDADAIGIMKFASAVASHITVESVQKLLQGTDVIGVVPFSRPTVNIFQGGNGMSALFGVRGFSMLVDTGFPRRTCCWDFIRHMDHIDVIVLPQVGESNVLGVQSFVERLAVGDVRTAIGQVFINAGQASAAGKTAGDEAAAGDSAAKQSDSLLLSLNEISISIVECLVKSHILCAPCIAKIPPQAINLYHKIGFGTLDMYVLNPLADNKDLKDFLVGWGKTTKPRLSKLSDLVSISTVVAFKPETRGDRPVRILFPGSSPVLKLYEGLDRLKTNPLFQTADGTAAHKSAGEKGTARPGTGTMKPGTARPASSSARDAHSSKASTGSRVATESRTSTAESKKTSSESTTAKTRDRQTARDAKSDPKSDSANRKDAKAHPTTSTPKKDTQKPSTPTRDVSDAKGSSAPPANKAKAMPSPIGKKTQSTARNSEKLDDAEAGIPPADKPAVKLDDVAVLDSSADVIPQLVPCTTEEAPIVSQVESQILTEPGDNHVTVSASDSAPVSESGPAKTKVDDDEKVVAAAGPSASGESAGDKVPQSGAEIDPIQSWDAPQSLPAPSDDKTAGSITLSNPGGERRGATGRSVPKDRASATAGKQTGRSTHPPASARGASSASGSTRKTARATTPFYVDLAYVPTYAVDGCDAEFFRRVRARYYIIPGSSADPHQLSMLADAKSAWEGEVTVIPTGNTDALIAWVMAHRDELTSLKIEVTPSVARSTLQLDRGSTCSAYRLEF